MRLLVVEDSALLGSLLEGSLTRMGYEVEWLRSHAELRAALDRGNPGCVVLDADMPDADFAAVQHEVRHRHVSAGLIVVSAPKPVSYRIKLLDLGADDYLPKPFDLSELGARVRAVQRRRQRACEMDECMSHGSLQIYPQQRTATWNGEPLNLSSREFVLLELMVQRKNQVLSRGLIHGMLHARGTETESNSVEVYIHKLRRKTSPGLILTLRGLGYQLGAPVEHA